MIYFLSIDFTKALIEIIIMLLIAYLLGILTHWLMFNKSTDENIDENLKEDHLLLNNKYELLIEDKNSIQNNYELVLAELNKNKLQNQRMEKSILEKDNELSILENKLLSIKHNVSEEKSILQSPKDSVLDNLPASAILSQSTTKTESAETSTNESKISEDNSDNQKVDNSAILAYLNEFENKKDEVVAETKKEEVIVEKKSETIEETNSSKSNIIEEKVELPTNQKLENLLGKIGAYKKKDDLKEINGIGPFIEEKLNSLGIFSFEQISNLDDNTIDLLNDLIQFFPGRIQRDNWVQQAKALIS